MIFYQKEKKELKVARSGNLQLIPVRATYIDWVIQMSKFKNEQRSKDEWR